MALPGIQSAPGILAPPRWARVHRRHPCPICGKGKGCRIREDGLVECLRIASGEPVTGALGGWRHRPEDYRPGSHQARTFAEPSPERAAPDDLDRVYRRLAEHLRLSATHRSHLVGLERQLTGDQVTRRGYLTWGWNERRFPGHVARQLYDEMGSVILSVPGFVLRRQSGRDQEYITLTGAPGLFLPVRDPEGRIVGAQLRWDRPRDGGGKYGWLSSSSRGGPSSGTPIHVARPLNELKRPGEVWITEGILKADIACDRLGALVASIPGVNAWRSSLLPTLERLRERGELQTVIVALDSDHTTKPQVAQARKEIAEHLARSGFPVELADWDPACKGLDDLLLAGGKPRREPYQVHGAGPRPLVPHIGPAPESSSGPTYTLQEARDELERQLGDFLTNAGGRFSQHGLLVRTPPGSGKSTILTRTVNQVLASRKRASVALFVSRHDLAKEDPERAAWGHVTGRTWSQATPDGPRRPCHLADHQAELARLRIPAQAGCERCPLLADCKANRQRDPGTPYYHAQFLDRRRATVYPAQHFLSASLWSHHACVVLDDVALSDLALEPLEIQRADLVRALEWAQRDLDGEHDAQKSLGPAQPLLRLLSDWLREAEDRRTPWSGRPLMVELERLARACGFSVGPLLEQAGTAQDPQPFQGKTLEQGLRAVPPRFLRDLVEVLSEELQHYENGEEHWNRRVYLEESSERPDRYALRLMLRRSLPTVALQDKPLIILDASATMEEVQQLFPTRTWTELSVRLEMPKTVQIFQDPSRRWGKTSLFDASAREQALIQIGQVLQKHPGQKVGLITHHSFEGHVKRRFPTLKTAHFYGQRGSNEFAEVDALIVFGSPSPNPHGLVQQAEALFFRESPLARAEYLEPRPLNTSQGPLWTVAVRTYQDPRLQALLRSKREEELLQAVYRARPLSVKTCHQRQLNLFESSEELKEPRLSCHIYCFTNQPLEGLKVHLTFEPAGRDEPSLEDLKKALQNAPRDPEGRRRQPTRAQLAQATSWKPRQLQAASDRIAALWLSLLRGDFMAQPPRALPEPLDPAAAERPPGDARALIWSHLRAHRKEPPAATCFPP